MSIETLKTFTSFSGADLIVSFGSKVIGELQQISWAIQREKAPVYTFGSPDPRSFSRGKRGIAGSLVFAVFNRDALMEEVKETITSWPNQYTAKGNLPTSAATGYNFSEDFSSLLSLTEWDDTTSGDFGKYGSGFTKGADGKDVAVGTALGQEPYGFGKINKDNILYIDQLPPFDVTLTFANEYGQAAFQKIYDLDVLNEGSGVSVDTIVMERQMTYIARRISPIIAGVYYRDTQGNVKGTDAK